MAERRVRRRACAWCGAEESPGTPPVTPLTVLWRSAVDAGLPMKCPESHYFHLLCAKMVRNRLRRLGNPDSFELVRRGVWRAARSKFGRQRRRNPLLATLGANPPRGVRQLNATWARIEYHRPDDPEGKNVMREHEFADGFIAEGLEDGSVLLRPHGRGKLWTVR